MKPMVGCEAFPNSAYGPMPPSLPVWSMSAYPRDSDLGSIRGERLVDHIAGHDLIRPTLVLDALRAISFDRFTSFHRRAMSRLFASVRTPANRRTIRAALVQRSSTSNRRNCVDRHSTSLLTRVLHVHGRTGPYAIKTLEHTNDDHHGQSADDPYPQG